MLIRISFHGLLNDFSLRPISDGVISPLHLNKVSVAVDFMRLHFFVVSVRYDSTCT